MSENDDQIKDFGTWSRRTDTQASGGMGDTGKTQGRDPIGGTKSDEKNDGKMSRRVFGKLMGSMLGMSVADRFLPRLEQDPSTRPPKENPDIQEELPSSGGEFENHYEPGWDRVLVRVDIEGNDFDNLESTRIFKDFETLAKPIDRLPESVVEQVRIQLRLEGDEMGPATEKILGEYNKMRASSASILKNLRQTYHEDYLAEMAPMALQFVEVSSYVEDVLDGRSEGVSEGMTSVKLYSLLERLYRDAQLSETGGYDRERGRESGERRLGVSMSLGEAENVELEQWNEEWFGPTEAIRDFLVEKYPVSSGDLWNIEMVANVEESESLQGEYGGFAIREQGKVQVQAGESALEILAHEMKHYPQANWMGLFDGQSERINSYMRFAPLSETMRLFEVATRATVELTELGDEIATNEFVTAFTVMRQTEAPLRGFEYRRLVSLCEKLGVDFPGVDESMETVSEWADDPDHFQEPRYLNNFTSGARLVMGLMKKVGGVEGIEQNLEDHEVSMMRRLLARGYDQMVHFLVDPAKAEDGSMYLKLNSVEGAESEFVAEKVRDIGNRVDAHYQEWMSGGVLSAGKVVSGEIEPYGAWVLVMNEAGLSRDFLQWSEGQMLPRLGESAVVEDYREEVESYKNKVRPLLGDETDKMWDRYVLDARANRIAGQVMLNWENYDTDEARLENIRAIYEINSEWLNYLRLGMNEEVVREYADEWVESLADLKIPDEAREYFVRLMVEGLPE